MSTPQRKNYHYIARKRRVVEDKRFVTGQGNFIQDQDLPGTLHVAVLPSPYPRAKIISINTEAAMSLAGVTAVVTGDELAEHTSPLYHGIPLPECKWYPLAHEMTRYAGEWVAAVVAESIYIAEDALDLIEVEYEALPVVVDPEEAMKPGAPLVHPGHGSNIIYEGDFGGGVHPPCRLKHLEF